MTAVNAVAVFVASERATQDRLYAQDVEVVSGDRFEPRGIGLFSLADGGGALLVQQQSGNTAEVVLEDTGVGVRNRRSLDAAGTDGLKHGELSGVHGAVERVQDHPVDPAKDGRGSGNTERQSKHCDRCQGWGPAEDTHRIPEVFKDGSHVVSWPLDAS